MKKVYSIFIVLIIFSIVILSASPSFARPRPGYYPHYHNGQFYTERSSNGHKPYDYDKEYLNKIIKHNKKAQKISEKYLEKLQRPELKQYAQDVINGQIQNVQQLETWKQEWYNK